MIEDLFTLLFDFDSIRADQTVVPSGKPSHGANNMTIKTIMIGAVLSTLAPSMILLATPSQAALTDGSDIAPLAPISRNVTQSHERVGTEVAGFGISIGFGKRFRGHRGLRSYGYRDRGFKRHHGFRRSGGVKRHRGFRRSGFRGHRGFQVRRGFSYCY